MTSTTSTTPKLHSPGLGAVNASAFGTLEHRRRLPGPAPAAIYARLLRIAIEAEVDAFSDELEDRFGRTPHRGQGFLLAIQKPKLAAAVSGVAKVDAGPKAVALSFS